MTLEAQNKDSLPKFSQFNPVMIEESINQILAENRKALDELLNNKEVPTWENLIVPLERLNNRLNSLWSAVTHVHAVVSSEPLRKVYKSCITKVTDYLTELNQNERLYEKLIQLENNGKHFSQAQKHFLKLELRNFHLAGVHLPANKKTQYLRLKQLLNELTNQFEENLLDATEAWFKCFDNKSELKGLPEHAIEAARAVAKEKKKEGWIFTLDFPSYISIMRYADDRKLRELFYWAYVTRASDVGPNAGRYDNSSIMNSILAYRDELAKLLGYETYAHLSLATKMARTPEEVLRFLHDLALQSYTKAQQEYKDLKMFAKTLNLEVIEPWDIEYITEKYRQQLYSISQEDFRPYFPEDKILEGLFVIVKKLFGIEVKEVLDVDKWHKDVRFFSLYDENKTICGQVYMDLYARNHKRGGAWMDECRNRIRHPHTVPQIPVAYLTCNFSSPAEGKPALFTHDEVVTLFHEFGHTLHHLLTQVDVAGVAGIHGVPWDAIELPSQFLEKWCWHVESLKLCAAHYETHEPLPHALFERLIQSRHYLSGIRMVRQLEFSLFDFRIHLEYKPGEPSFIQRVLNEVRQEVSVIPVPDFNRFQHSFSHIFAGGYAAGYYSYKWAEVLACDAFSRFEEEGIFDTEAGLSFRNEILAKGGSEEPMDLFVAFRGRKPMIDALLRHEGIKNK